MGQALRAWIEPVPWPAWFTATTRWPVSASQADVMVQRFERWLSPWWRHGFVGAELFKLGERMGTLHFHGLLYRPDPSERPYDEARAFLEHTLGRCEVEPVENVGGVVAYVTKYVTKETLSWWMW